MSFIPRQYSWVCSTGMNMSVENNMLHLYHNHPACSPSYTDEEQKTLQSIPKQCLWLVDHSFDRAIKTCAVYSSIEILIIFSVFCVHLKVRIAYSVHSVRDIKYILFFYVPNILFCFIYIFYKQQLLDKIYFILYLNN